MAASDVLALSRAYTHIRRYTPSRARTCIRHHARAHTHVGPVRAHRDVSQRNVMLELESHVEELEDALAESEERMRTREEEYR